MVKVEALVKFYNGVKAVEDVSFQAGPGEVLALLGPNGAGKSTTLKALVGLVRPTRGRVAIAGYDPWSQPREAKRFVGYLPQHVDFPPSFTGEEILAFYAGLRGVPITGVEEAVELMGLKDFLHRPVGTFSGGMKQRLGLAVALLGEPPVLVLDEPTLSLDSEGRLALRGIVASWRGLGRTVIFSSHVVRDTEEMATTVAILKQGRLVVVEEVGKLKQRFRPRLRVHVSGAGESAKDLLALQHHPVVYENSHLVISCPPEERLAVLQSIAEAGIAVVGFATEDPPVEEIIMEILKEGEE